MRNGMNIVFGSMAVALAFTFQAVGQLNEPAQDPAFQQPQTDPQQQQTEAPEPAQVPPAPQRDLVATVNGEPIARSEFEQLVQTTIRARQQQQEAQPELPPLGIQQVQQQVLDNLIEARLVEQYVREHGPDVEEQEVDAELNRVRQGLQEQGASLEQYLAATKQPLDELRQRIEGSLAWQRFQQQQMSPDKLQEFYEQQRPRFGEATFEQVQPQVMQLYVARIWEDIVNQMKPQAKIQVAQPQINTGEVPVPQPQVPRP
ncbi:MAG: hypothetical protein EA424_08890 [Planctomycetaceae bacterium]|nr:MAG: hypothetical protein EA424_08890 [Planctomycetaceae bacterium]